jgi:hypothetical protein
MDRRRFLFAGLAAATGAALVPTVAAASGIGAGAAPLPRTLPDGLDGMADEDLLVPAQWGPPPGRGRRRRRCRIVQRRVAYRDRYGRVRYRLVDREVCR